MTGVLEIFLQIPTIALLLHRISHVAHCVNILTKALPLFILLLKITYVELMVGEVEACTCVTYISKSKVHIRSLNFLHCVIPVHKLLKYVITVPKRDLGLKSVHYGSCPSLAPMDISRKPPMYSFSFKLHSFPGVAGSEQDQTS